MTLAEHTQGIRNDISAQRSAIVQLEKKKTASIIAASVSMTAFLCFLAFASFPVWNLLLVLGLALYATFNVFDSIDDLKEVRDCLNQNVFYHGVLVEEAFTGKEIGPKFD